MGRSRFHTASAGQRPRQRLTGLRTYLHFGLFDHLQRVIDLDAEVPDSASQLGKIRDTLVRRRGAGTSVLPRTTRDRR